MTTPAYHRHGVTVLAGDCLDILRELDDASVDAVCTDPPYGIRFMGQAWDGADIEAGIELRRGQAPMPEDGKAGRTGGYQSAAAEAGRYDRAPSANEAFQRWCQAWAAECLRVLKPGGHMLAFGSPRTAHRLAAGIEDAGFEIRDTIMWVYGSGFPKSLDVSKAITATERHGGANSVRIRRARLGDEAASTGRAGNRDGVGGPQANRLGDDPTRHVETELTENGARWQGWGTALKPAQEPIIVARKPLASTVAGNVLAHGTGALNIDATRVSPSSPAHVEHASAPRSPRGSQHGKASDAPAPSRGSGPCTCAAPPACSTGDTSPDRECEPPRRTPSMPVQGSSDAQPDPRTGLPASAQAHDLTRPSRPGSLVDCQTSPHSDGEHARSAEDGDRANAQPRLDAPGCPDPRGTSARTPTSSRSTACPQHTAQHVDSAGRWPANVVLTHHSDCADPGPCTDGCPVAELDQQSGTLKSGAYNPGKRSDGAIYGAFNGENPGHAASEGGASRFFPVFRYQAKAPTKERPEVDGVKHLTVKPLALMQWLVRLVTPPGGLVLDPFAGSGTTLHAARAEGMRSIGVEREPDYLRLIAARLDARPRAAAPAAAAVTDDEPRDLLDLLDDAS
jgi:DNA modification methylase